MKSGTGCCLCPRGLRGLFLSAGPGALAAAFELQDGRLLLLVAPLREPVESSPHQGKTLGGIYLRLRPTHHHRMPCALSQFIPQPWATAQSEPSPLAIAPVCPKAVGFEVCCVPGSLAGPWPLTEFSGDKLCTQMGKQRAERSYVNCPASLSMWQRKDQRPGPRDPDKVLGRNV